MPQRKTFKEQVQEALQDRDLELGDLANAMGVTLGYASRLWNDLEDNISMQAIEKVCAALRIQPIEIDLYVEKALPYLAQHDDALRDAGRKILRKRPLTGVAGRGPKHLRR